MSSEDEDDFEAARVANIVECCLSDPYGGRSVPATILPRNGEMNA